MLYLANSCVFLTMAVFGLIVSSLVLMVRLSVPHESTARANEPRDPTTKQTDSWIAWTP